MHTCTRTQIYTLKIQNKITFQIRKRLEKKVARVRIDVRREAR